MKNEEFPKQEKVHRKFFILPHSGYSSLNRHYLLILGRQHVINLLDVFVMHLLQLLFAAFLGIFGEAFFHGLLQGINGVAAGVAHAHFGVLAFGLALLGQLLAWPVAYDAPR